ncbi:ARM repeat-containing protein [Durotheca rogersii]|uniref:ARM repeat-containing protein n=1 Tax=Durotheca rogersii TaxID=419775 RepID=UPI00221F647C|nr:ARM repeat-containing protein [Durotheca rogersii]KAI5854087.1 ARM repeat-containing protein [Durotheca rogersii]
MAAPINGNMGMGGEGVGAHPPTAVDPETMSILPEIHGALEIIHSPFSSNDSRKDAQIFLENVKDNEKASYYGFRLAIDKTQPPVVRHYALSLLEHAIKHRWAEYTDSQAVALRSCVLELSRNVSRDDPAYLRNKIASLWVEVAKRSWADDWMDMDSLLVQLWRVPDSAVHKELVLCILEMLSDDIFAGDDAVVAVREGVLSKASVEIFTPTAVLTETFPNRQAGPDVRCGDEGWLGRVTELLRHCLSGDVQHHPELRSCAIRALAVIYSLMPWIVPNAVTATRCVEVMCEGLRAPHIEVQKACLEAMHSLYSRTTFIDHEFLDLVVPLYDTKCVDLFRRLYEWSVVDPEDIDDDKYQFSKKLSELISFFGTYMDRRFNVLPNDPERIDFQGFLQLLLMVTQSPSLVVSIPVLVTWTRILNNRSLGPNIADMPTIVGPLLELCSSRLVRYENLPEDTQDATFLFLLEDTDTVPERHAFLGNYRRYSSQVIEGIVQLKVTDAMQHILGQTENVLEHLYDDAPPFNMANYSKTSQPVLRIDAQATVIEAALKGFGKWRVSRDDPGHEHEIISLEGNLESWCNRLLTMKFEDPLIRKRILQLLVAFSVIALDRNASFMLKVLEHILVTWPAIHPEHRLYADAIKELQSESMVELQRLAAKMPDHLLDVYDQIEAKVNEMIASGTLDEKRQITYQTFLFTIVHRSTRLDQSTKAQKLRGFINPVVAQWRDERLKQALSSYTGFCELMALDKAQSYLARKQMQNISDWGSVELDAEGQALQIELEERQTVLPLRPTKSFLTCSVDKIDKDTDPHRVSCALWQDGFPSILPELLNFLNHAHASHTPEKWTGLPSEMRSIVGRVLTDRFWQAGISEGSKDEFYARVLEKKLTLEGLASTIRGSIRFVRESCYAIIYGMTRLDVQFYGFDELPGPLAHALLADSFNLSAHQLINVLNLVRYLVDNCPVPLREHFLPPILAVCCQQMDARINSEWMNLDQQQTVKSGGDALTEEMKSESILRQLTYASVMMVADFLDPARSNSPAGSSNLDEAAKYPTLREFCLMHSSIAEPLLVFCTHALRWRDSRCCGMMLRVFRSIVPEFAVGESPSPRSVGAKQTSIPSGTATAIREYISSDVVKACITSIHEPYFVELQKDFAHLIATAIVTYSRFTMTARDVLASLPNMKPTDVDSGIAYMLRSETSSRGQRGVILQLLGDLKGVSVSEMGKLNKSVGTPTVKHSVTKRPTRSKMTQQFMTTPSGGFDASRPSGASDGREDGNGDGLEGLASLFDS